MSNGRRSAWRKLLSAGLCCLIAVLAAACGEPQQPEPATVPATQAPAAAPTQPPTEPPTDPPTQAPTEPPTRYRDDGVRSDPNDVGDASGFVLVSDVIPDVRLDIRYYSDYNFVGERINGYEEPVAILSKEAALALRDVADDLREQGYLLIIYDAYRPQRAVDHFVSWAGDVSDQRMKSDFYPDVDKSLLFDYSYIGYRSGHSRGSTVDVSLYSIADDAEADMGGSFDWFSEVSHPDYGGVTAEQYSNRMLLREAMTSHGFEPLYSEWWHFSLVSEPYPYTYFDFPVSRESLQ